MINRRDHFRIGLHPLYRVKYDILCSLLGEKWQPFQGVRTVEEQERLFRQKNKVTDAKGGDSAHNYGCATDWTIFTESGLPTWMEDDDPLWQEYFAACLKAGLRSGKAFGDRVHNQLPISIRWKRVGNVCRTEGMEAALELIQESIIDA